MEPRWLDSREQEVWRSFLSLSRLVRQVTERQLVRDSDMPHTYYAILVSLSEAPGNLMRMSDLAAAAEGSQSQLSHAVAKLERRGWVSRRRCGTDGRGWNAVLEPAGRAALEAAAPGHVATVRELLFDALSVEEQTQLARICRVVLDQAKRRGCTEATTDGEPAVPRDRPVDRP